MRRRYSVPAGRSENPSAWPRRIRLILLASVGLCVASYLTLYQLGLLTEVWDPFFPNGSPKVLHLLEPVPDAALGALAYLAEIVLSLVGGEERWRTAPWTVLALGFVVFCGAAVSILLIIVQAVVVGAWCTPCLVSAFVSFVIFGSGVDEPLAAFRYLAKVRERGGSLREALRGNPDG